MSYTLMIMINVKKIQRNRSRYSSNDDYRCSHYYDYQGDYYYHGSDHRRNSNDPCWSYFYLPNKRGILRHSWYMWARLLCVRLWLTLRVGMSLTNDSTEGSICY